MRILKFIFNTKYKKDIRNTNSVIINYCLPYCNFMYLTKQITVRRMIKDIKFFYFECYQFFDSTLGEFEK